MGNSLCNEIGRLEALLKQREAELESDKRQKEQAKKNGNYQNAAKMYNCGGKSMNIYDQCIYHSKEAVKRAKQDLAAAKKKAR